MLLGTYVGSWLEALAMRKKWIKVYLSRELRRFLRRLAEGLGIGESEVLRQVFMEYAKSISLITETMRARNMSSNVEEITI